jgi:diguanylate cyclase (GGDEF)-like protein
MNNLKMTNDSKGHLAGDLLIKNTADLIVTVCNSNDLTVRIGGDEFIILIPNSTEMDIREKMKQLQEKAKDKGISFALGHSIKTQKVSFDEVYRQAEDRMYMDKDLKR